MVWPGGSLMTPAQYCPHFFKISQNEKFQVKIIISTGEIVGLAEGIIDNTRLEMYI